MVWFRTDDGFNSHPKVLSIPRGAPRLRAVGLWHAIGVWCAQQLTDGLFAPHMITEHGGNRADAKWLLDATLWHRLGEGCDTETCPAGVPGMHRMHDYLDQNPSRDQVLAERAAAADRQRRARAKAKQNRDTSRRDGRVTHADVTSVVTVPPTRPDPSSTAAAAEEPDAVTPLPPPLVILRAALEARKLVVSWGRLKPEQITEIEQLVELHGDAALVASALRAYQPNKPIAYAQGWLKDWRQLRRPGDLAAVPDEPCPEPGHHGTTTRCTQCAAERIGGLKEGPTE